MPVGAGLFGAFAEYLRNKRYELKKCIKSKPDRPYLVTKEDTFYCDTCKYGFSTKNKFDHHASSEIHLLKRIHHRDKTSLKKKTDYLQVNIIPPTLNVEQDETTFEISCVNIALDGSKVRIHKIFELVNYGAEMKLKCGSNYCLKKGDSFKINMRAKNTGFEPSFSLYPVVLRVSRNDSSLNDYVLIEPHFRVSSKNTFQASPKSDVSHSKTQDRNVNKGHIIFDSESSRLQQHVIPGTPNAHNSTIGINRTSSTNTRPLLKKDELIHNVSKCFKKSVSNSENEDKSQKLPRTLKNHVLHSKTQDQNINKQSTTVEPSLVRQDSSSSHHSTIRIAKTPSADTQKVKNEFISGSEKGKDGTQTLRSALKNHNNLPRSRTPDRNKNDPSTPHRVVNDAPIHNLSKSFKESIGNKKFISSSENEKDESQTLRSSLKNHNNLPRSRTPDRNKNDPSTPHRVVNDAPIHNLSKRFKESIRNKEFIGSSESGKNNRVHHQKTPHQNKKNERTNTSESSLPRRDVISDEFNACFSNINIDGSKTPTRRVKIGVTLTTDGDEIEEYVYKRKKKSIRNLPRPTTPRLKKDEPLTQIARASEFPRTKLDENNIPHVLQTLIKNEFKTAAFSWSAKQKEELYKIRKLICEEGTLKLQHNKGVLWERNYIQRLRTIMWIEEYPELEEIRSYRRKDVDVLTDKLSENLIGIPLPGLSEENISLSTADAVTLTVKSLNLPRKVQRSEGKVELIEKEAVYVKLFHNRYYNFECWKYKTDVEFRYNRISMRMKHAALDNIGKLNWQQWLFPRRFEQNANNIKIRRFFNKTIATNELQVQAITNIVQNRAFPAPYILFGPPGTGKTATLVEAVVQIWDTINTSRICVCASSNTAADVIAERLLQYIPTKDIIRVYALSRNGEEIISELRECCNYDSKSKEVFAPCLDELKCRRVVVMTPVTSGRFVSSGITFNYVFMDEAGHALETDVLIPICGFLSCAQCSLVLSGDPQQLGPVVKSSYANALGFGMSLLERLMSQCDIYKKGLFRNYNPKVITMLENNYRSHEDILHIPNERFYNNELQAKAPEDVVNSLCQWKHLPSKGFPIIFHGVKGQEERENSPSFFNAREANVVVKYVRDLFNSKNIQIEQSEIGIISPYRAQIQKIRQKLLRSWPKINVASVDEFQGQERKVIIISTVRSRYEKSATDYKYGLGFLKNEKRFNVAITRAVALLIVIGDPDVLQCDPHWKALINYCAENRAFVGEQAKGTVPDDFDSNVNRDIYLKEFRI